MTDPFSPTCHNGHRKFTHRREHQMAFLKALGETGSVAHASGHRRCRAPGPTNDRPLLYVMGKFSR